jgi:hypothetical protein
MAELPPACLEPEIRCICPGISLARDRESERAIRDYAAAARDVQNPTAVFERDGDVDLRWPQSNGGVSFDRGIDAEAPQQRTN